MILAGLEGLLERARQLVSQQATLQDLLDQPNNLAQSQLLYCI